jgi:anaerobic ribonucleoside-triphosphate reductase activating protein
MKYVDVLVDGPYIESMRDISQAWRGSINQMVIDVQASIKNNTITLYE